MTATFDDDDVFGPSSSRFQAKKATQRKTPSVNGRQSSASLRGASLAQTLDADAGTGVHSLAHELAAALISTEDTGSKKLSDELGFEFDEGAEGIDGSAQGDSGGPPSTDESVVEAFGMPEQPAFGEPTADYEEPVFGNPDDLRSESAFGGDDNELDPSFETPTKPSRQKREPEKDPMVILAEDLESTEKFLTQLRRLDLEPGGQPHMEKLASDVIRRLDDTVREREGQVRELLEYEREFRRIAGEVGGNDALGHLDELDDLVHEPEPEQRPRPPARSKTLDYIAEEDMSGPHTLANGDDWETERDRLGDEEDEFDAPQSPVKPPIAAAPTMTGPPTPSVTIVQLAHFRTVTNTVASSLATISEQTQVNTAAATEAGRKIRALKNKLGEWRTEWESAERSRTKIEKWEAGVMDVGEGTLVVLPMTGTPPRPGRSKVDGRKIVQAHIDAFAQVMLEANARIEMIKAAIP